MTVKETLIAARALIDTPEKWCQHVGEDGNGRICSSTALNRSSATGMNASAYMHLAKTMADIEGREWTMVCEFNDHHTHSEVMAAFDRAIASASEEARWSSSTRILRKSPTKS